MEMLNKKIGITGATGGLGQKICLFFAQKGANFVFIDRNLEKSQKMAQKIQESYPDVKIEFVTCDLSNLSSVKNAATSLEKIDLDILILNSGIYNVPLQKLDSGFNNIFQVNFLSQYYLVRYLMEKGKVKKVVAISSIAHRVAKLDENDIDYSNYKKPLKIYGNSKRFLMFSLMGYFKDKKDVQLAITHPGITLTNMTSHYAKWINPFVKFFGKIFFPSPKKAARNITFAVENECDTSSWIGPKVFDIWGKPKSKKIKLDSESVKIAEIANVLYEKIRG